MTSKKTKIQTSQQQTIEGHEWLGAAALSSLIFGYTMREAIVNDEPIGYVIGFGAAVFAVLTYGVWGTYKDEQSLESIRVQTPQRVKESMIQVRDLSPKYSHNHSYLFGPGMRI